MTEETRSDTPADTLTWAARKRCPLQVVDAASAYTMTGEARALSLAR